MKKNLCAQKPKDSPRIRIPAGNYEAVCIKSEEFKYLGQEKRLYLHFKIIKGEYAETILFCSYNSDYKLFPRNSKYYTDWAIANGDLPRRNDRMTPQVFKKNLFLVKVRDASPKYNDGTPKPNMFKYSVIDRVIEKLTGVLSETCY